MGGKLGEGPIGVVGAGVMGSGITQVAAQAGRRVLLFDVRPGAAAKARDMIAVALSRSVERGRLRPDERDATLSRISPADSLEAFGRCVLVIEAIAEDLPAKRALFAEIERIVAASAILASNTSSISITALAAGLARPERVAGMHFFNPAPLMALVEVVSGLDTSEETAAIVHATATAWGKAPVHARSTPGFIVNRCARPFYAEGLRLLEEQAADIATIDAIVREAGGFRMGPFELMDLIGHDVNFAVTTSVWRAYFHDPRYAPSIAQQELVESGRLGRKTGRGFYDYSASAPPRAAAIHPPAPRPARIEIHGDLGPAAALADLAEHAVIAVAHMDGPGLLRIGDAVICLTNGRTATRRAAETGEANTVLFDLALDFAKTPRIALAAAEQADATALASAAGFFQALGKSVSVIGDAPGLVVMRLLAMLANEAAEAIYRGVAHAEDIDLAMMKGVNYPVGPLTWASRVGLRRIVTALDNMAATYGEDRYRASVLLRRKQESGRGF